MGGHWDSISETLGSEGVKGYLGPLLLFFFESHFGDLSVPFFETGILFVFFLFVCFVSLLFWRTQKVSHNDSQKGLLGEPQEGSRLGGSLIFTFAAEPKKGSKMGAKMERLGSQGRHYTPFCSPMSRMFAFKKL